MKLNEKIFYCRRKAGLSQEALAEELGVSRQAVSKWETGDAVPEISKLLALAKTFDVTTDWLLSEEEPEDNNANTNYYQETVNWGSCAADFSGEKDTATSAERFEKAADDWMERVPGVLGKMVRKFGWIAGVYIAAVGAGFTALGAIMKTIVNSMMNGFNNAANSMMSGFGGWGSSSVTFYDESGNPLSAKESAELAKLFADSGENIFASQGTMDGFMNSGMGAMNSMMQSNPVSILANIMIIGGLIALIGGSIFAVIWYKKSKDVQA